MGIGRQSLLPADSGCMHPTRTALEAAEGARVGVQLGDPRRNGLFSCTNPDVPLQLAEDRGWCVLGGGGSSTEHWGHMHFLERARDF